jgi:outer membrane protein OmpA-like peptidoglycan-associated protein
VSRISTRLHADEDHWIPLSDLMTGLMFLFLVIALAYMVQIELQAARTKRIAVLYQKTRIDLYNDLNREFHTDLPKWGAVLKRDDLSIRFTEPKVLFATDSDQLTPLFQSILSDFFPRYVRILTGDKYRTSVTEVRIEGYTSTLWHGGATLQEAYIGNMDLSQRRTRSVLQYVLALPGLQSSQSWLMENVTANGLSFSHLVRENGRENTALSQRVEFKVRTNADEQLHEILTVSK